MQELIADRKQAEVSEFLSAGSSIGRALLLSRMVPPERVAALRQAFMAMTNDPKFVQDTVKSGLELDAVSGERIFMGNDLSSAKQVFEGDATGFPGNTRT